MGYMTPILILNDALENVKENPTQVVDNILKGMEMYDHSKEFSIGNHTNPMQVLRPHHANIPKMILSHGNQFMELGRGNQVKNIDYRKKMLERAKQILEEEERSIQELEVSGEGF